jgi:hypothetical protein
MIYLWVASVVVAFVAGALVFRNNAKNANAAIAKVETVAKTVKDATK